MQALKKNKQLIGLACAAILGMIIGALLVHAPILNKATDRSEEIIKDFIELYFKSGVWYQKTKWLGITSTQNPCDNWVMQEIISEIKPDIIIETGTMNGGSTLFYATVLEKVNENGKIITVDIDPQVQEASEFEVFKDRVEVIKGDSVSPEVIDAIAEQVENRKVLVTLDSLHTKEHVLKELNLYSRFVSVNSYLVVQDTAIDQYEFLPNDYGPGPLRAIEEFLKTNKDFEIDHSREKFILTFYPSGYLKRIK